MGKSTFCSGVALLFFFPLVAFAQSDPGASGCAFGTDFAGVTVTQPPGITLNPGGVSSIYNPFEDWETVDWAAYPGSLAHTGDDTYAQDWRYKNSHPLSLGRNVFAAISGVVACMSNVQPALFGNEMVIWDPQSGFALRYAHLSALNPTLHPGDLVKAGVDVVGQVGSTGTNSNSHHLHLVAYKGVSKIAGTPLVQVRGNAGGVTPFAAQYTLVPSTTKPFTMLYAGHTAIGSGGKPWTRATPSCQGGVIDTTLGRSGNNVFEFIDLSPSCHHWYFRLGPLDSNDDVSMQMRVAVDSSSAPDALVAGVADGIKKIQVGFTPGAVGLLDGNGGFLGLPIFADLTFDPATMHTYRIEKDNSNNTVNLYVDGALAQTVPYSNLPNFTPTTYQQFFGAASVSGTAEGHFDWVFYRNIVN